MKDAADHEMSLDLETLVTELSVKEQLAQSTVRIVARDSAGSVSTGTGFFLSFSASDAEGYVFLITNKHVVEGMSSGEFELSAVGSPDPKRRQRLYVRFDKDFERAWIQHPDADVDLAACAVNHLIRHIEENGREVSITTLSDELIPTSEEMREFTAADDILMIGYPNGLWDSHNNMPIIRRGITATHPYLNYEGREEFMIDAACFPGSSGSPVMLFNGGAYISRDGATVVGSRLKLLGVLYAGPAYTVKGEIEIVTIPTAERAVAFSHIPNNLGLVIKAQKLFAFRPAEDENRYLESSHLVSSAKYESNDLDV